jgi:hypothetical protein
LDRNANPCTMITSVVVASLDFLDNSKYTLYRRRRERLLFQKNKPGWCSQTMPRENLTMTESEEPEGLRNTVFRCCVSVVLELRTPLFFNSLDSSFDGFPSSFSRKPCVLRAAATYPYKGVVGFEELPRFILVVLHPLFWGQRRLLKR